MAPRQQDELFGTITTGRTIWHTSQIMFLWTSTVGRCSRVLCILVPRRGASTSPAIRAACSPASLHTQAISALWGDQEDIFWVATVFVELHIHHPRAASLPMYANGKHPCDLRMHNSMFEKTGANKAQSFLCTCHVHFEGTRLSVPIPSQSVWARNLTPYVHL